MSAGLPGLGLGGMFFILSALLAPLVELIRTLKGGSSVAAWLRVGRQFAIAVTMIVAINATVHGLYLLASLVGLGDAGSPGSLFVLPLLPIAITVGALCTLLLVAEAAALASRARERGLRAPPRAAAVALPSPGRLLAGVGALTMACFVLLALGATELSPIPSGPGLSDAAPVSGEGSQGPAYAHRAMASASPDRPGLRTSTQDSQTPNQPSAPETSARGQGDATTDSDGTTQSGDGGEASAPPGSQPQDGAPPSASTSEPAPEPADPPATDPAPSPAQPDTGPPDTAGPPPAAGPPESSNAPPGTGPAESSGPQA